MRVYLPATYAMLEDLAREGSHPIRSGVGFALTPAVREFYHDGDEEELAYSAFLDAARASLRLLATGDAPARFPHRRVVLSVDVPDAQVTLSPSDGESVVRISPAEFAVDQLAAIHLDDAEAEEDTRAAIDAIDAADLGDEDAQITLGDCEDHLMSWYDGAELPFLIELM